MAPCFPWIFLTVMELFILTAIGMDMEISLPLALMPAAAAVFFLTRIKLENAHVFDQPVVALGGLGTVALTVVSTDITPLLFWLPSTGFVALLVLTSRHLQSPRDSRNSYSRH